MRTLHLVIRALIGLVTVITSPSFAAETNAAPQSFRASIGGFLGVCYSVELREGSLYYLAADAPQKAQTLKLTPTSQQWREFRRALDDVGVWQWRTNYPNPGVYDGTQWSLEIRYGDRTLKTQGSNNFPGRAGKPSGSPKETKAFSAYAAAVKRLLGGKEFQ